MGRPADVLRPPYFYLILRIMSSSESRNEEACLETLTSSIVHGDSPPGSLFKEHLTTFEQRCLGSFRYLSQLWKCSGPRWHFPWDATHSMIIEFVLLEYYRSWLWRSQPLFQPSKGGQMDKTPRWFCWGCLHDSFKSYLVRPSPLLSITLLVSNNCLTSSFDLVLASREITKAPPNEELKKPLSDS